MVACVVKFVLGPDTTWEAQRISDVIWSRLKGYTGFRNYSFLAEYDTGEYVGIGYWETRDDALEANQKIFPLITEMVGSNYQWEPCTLLYDVYDPNLHRTEGNS